MNSYGFSLIMISSMQNIQVITPYSLAMLLYKILAQTSVSLLNSSGSTYFLSHKILQSICSVFLINRISIFIFCITTLLNSMSPPLFFFFLFSFTDYAIKLAWVIFSLHFATAVMQKRAKNNVILKDTLKFQRDYSIVMFRVFFKTLSHIRYKVYDSFSNIFMDLASIFSENNLSLKQYTL